MLWFFGVLAAVVLAVVAALATPVHVGVRLRRTDRTRARWRVRALAGLIDVRFGGETATEPDASPEAQAARAERPRRRRGRKPGAGLAVLRSPGFAGRAMRVVPDLGRRIRWEEFSLEATFGFDDPADTGQLYGLLSPLLVAGAAAGWPIRCEPRFTGACFEGACAAGARLRPLAVIWVALRFLASPTTFRAVRAWRAHR